MADLFARYICRHVVLIRVPGDASGIHRSRADFLSPVDKRDNRPDSARSALCARVLP